MQASFALEIGLPVALGIIMLGLGLSLKITDFMAVLGKPRPLIIGLVCHSLILPLLCLALVLLLRLPPAVAVGMMLLAASPAGSTGALFTHLARGDVALSITMSAVTAVVSIVTLPLVSSASRLVFFGDGQAVLLGWSQVMQFAGIALVPALAGVAIRSRFPAVAEMLERPVKAMAMAFLAAIVVFALTKNWNLVGLWGPTAGLAAAGFAMLSLAVGYLVPRLLRVCRAQAVALAMTIVIHNAALIITMAMSELMLSEPQMAIPPAMYGLVAYIAAGAFTAMLNSRRMAQAALPA